MRKRARVQEDNDYFEMRLRGVHAFSTHTQTDRHTQTHTMMIMMITMILHTLCYSVPVGAPVSSRFLLDRSSARVRVRLRLLDRLFWKVY